MDNRLEEYFVKQYPHLFRDYRDDMRKTCMAWGCECANGWFHIMNEAFKRAEHPGVALLQVKEKFGGLRLYWIGTGTPPLTEEKAETVRIAMDTAESRSYHVCEQCGNSGKQRGGGWIFTLCDKCYDINQNGERHELWARSVAYGNKIAKELGLRITCATEKNHQPDIDYKYCVICEQVLRYIAPTVATEEEKLTFFNCPQKNCHGTIAKINKWTCNVCDIKVIVTRPVIKKEEKPDEDNFQEA